jgi:iron complex outermembrane receptor protein
MAADNNKPARKNDHPRRYLPMKLKPLYYSMMMLSATSIGNGAYAAEPLVLEEVLVTAQKREQSLQNVPMSVSAMSGDTIRSLGAVDFRGLSTQLANVNIANDQDSIDIAIRGVSNNRGFAPATAFHIDGIYTGQSQSGLTAFLDVERVEVLRGPQGTLYGRNATAGAINVITNRPDSAESSASVEVTAGDYDLLKIEAVGNLPLIEDKLALRVALHKEERDGYMEHDGFGFAQEDSDGSDVEGGKIRMLFQPTDKIEWLVGYDFTEQGGTGARFYTDIEHLIPLEDLLAQVPAGSSAAAITGILQPGARFAALPLDQQQRILNDPRYVPVSYSNETDPEVIARNQLTQDMDQKTYMTELKAELGSIDLTFLGGYRELDSKRSGDNDFWAGNRTNVSEVEATEESYELRIAQNGDTLQWLAGLYYYNNDSESLFDAGAPSGFGSDTTSSAVFGQATWSISDTLSVTGGLRYSEDEIDGSSLLDPSEPESSVKFDDVSWKLSVEKNLTEVSLLYGSVSTGYKTGGLNGGSQSNPTFDQEEVIAYEIGSKNQLHDGRLQLNVAIFYYDYSDLQVSGIDVVPQLDEEGNPIPDPDNPGAFLVESVNTSNSNIDSSEMYGAEIEWIALVSDNFLIDGNIGLLKTDVGNGEVDNAAIFGAVPTDVSGNQLRKAPESSFNLGLQHTLELSSLGGSLTSRLDFHYEDEQYHDVLNRPQDLEGSYTKTDISTTYRNDSGRYFVQLYGRNLEDNDVRTTIFQSAIGPTSAFAAPRTYGIRGGFNF